MRASLLVHLPVAAGTRQARAADERRLACVRGEHPMKYPEAPAIRLGDPDVDPDDFDEDEDEEDDEDDEDDEDEDGDGQKWYVGVSGRACIQMRPCA